MAWLVAFMNSLIKVDPELLFVERAWSRYRWRQVWNQVFHWAWFLIGFSSTACLVCSVKSCLLDNAFWYNCFIQGHGDEFIDVSLWLLRALLVKQRISLLHLLLCRNRLHSYMFLWRLASLRCSLMHSRLFCCEHIHVLTDYLGYLKVAD